MRRVVSRDWTSGILKWFPRNFKLLKGKVLLAQKTMKNTGNPVNETTRGRAAQRRYRDYRGEGATSALSAALSFEVDIALVDSRDYWMFL